MADKVFYVGAQDRTNSLTGFVPAKFLMRNGAYVMDPTPGGSQKAYLYSDGLGNNKTSGSVANPNNYLIVPANYAEQQARDFADRIAGIVGRIYPEDEMGAAAHHQALAEMTGAFWPGGSQDLQRHPQWGIPKGSVVPAFVGSASNHLGYVTGLAGLPMDWSEIGGGFLNGGNAVWQSIKRLAHSDSVSIDTDGPHWLSKQNHANISQGFSDGLSAGKPSSPFNDYGYGPQAQRATGQIGDGNGVGGMIPSVAGINPSNPTQPTPPLTGGALGLPNRQPAQYPSQASGNMPQPSVFDTGAPPVPYLSAIRSVSRANGNNLPAPVPDPGAPAAQFALPDSLRLKGDIVDFLATLAGVGPQNPTQWAAPPQDDQLRGFYRDDPTQPWFARGGLY